MKREIISDKAQDYVSRIYSENEYPVGLNDIESDVYEAFIDGARWRINAAWHDVTVACKPNRKALVLFKNGNAAVYKDLRDLSFELLWGEVDKFAYLDDLLPDTRKEAER